jgi:hypothetical protein
MSKLPKKSAQQWKMTRGIMAQMCFRREFKQVNKSQAGDASGLFKPGGRGYLGNC